MLMKTHFEVKIMLMSGLFLETQVNVVVVVTIIAKTRLYSKWFKVVLLKQGVFLCTFREVIRGTCLRWVEFWREQDVI